MASTYQKVESLNGEYLERQANLDAIVDGQVLVQEALLGNNEAKIIHIIFCTFLTTLCQELATEV